MTAQMIKGHMKKINHFAVKTLYNNYGFRLPENMQVEFSQLLEKHSHEVGHSLNPEELNRFFCQEFIENLHPYELTAINFEKEFVNTERERLICRTTIKHHNKPQEIVGVGNGALNALANAFKQHYGIELEVVDYLQHGLTKGIHALAASYIEVFNKQGQHIWGVGIDSDCTLSAIRALLSAVNRSQR